MSTYRNRLLQELPAQELQNLAPCLERVGLPVKTVLIQPDQAIGSIYFLESGLGSEVIVCGEKNQIEVGLIGREGFIGLPIVLDRESSPHRTFMQLGGVGLRISTQELRSRLKHSPVLHRRLLHFTHDFLLQLGQTVHANGRHKIPARLARWILMSADRNDGSPLRLTHEFLGLMLGVRRAGVSEALAVLEERGLIKAMHAGISITNRAGLEDVAQAIYAKPDRLPVIDPAAASA